MENILEKNKRNELYNLKDEIFEYPYKIQKGRFIKKDWIAVPFETIGEFITEKAELLSHKLKQHGFNEFLAIEAEGFVVERYVGDDVGIYRFNNTIEEFEGIWRYRGLFFVVITPNVDVILLNTPDDYSVLVGPKYFVEDIFEDNIESIRKKFIEYITYLFSDDYPKEFKYLLNVAKYYEEFNNESVK